MAQLGQIFSTGMYCSTGHVKFQTGILLNGKCPRTRDFREQIQLAIRARFGEYTDPIPKLNVVYSAGNGRHLLPSAKLTFSSQWISQDISLFLHEISLSLEISVHKSLSLFNF